MNSNGIYDIEKISRGKYDIFKIYERFQAAMYLVCGSERACLIDTGFGLTDLSALAAELTGLPVFVINTHGHNDHILGNHWFCRAFLNNADKPMHDWTVSGFVKMLSDPMVKEQYGGFIKNMDISAVHFPETEDISEKDVIDLGDKQLEVIEVPGHTPGSIMLLDRSEKICFSGDSIIEHLWLFLKESLPPEIYLRSLRRAEDIMEKAGIERIYNGHYNYHPLTMGDAADISSIAEKICDGTASGKPFENKNGSGVEYSDGKFSIICREGS